MKSEKTTEQNSSTPLQFKPLSEGLGFHPFSDGLPYAPISHSPSSTVRTPPVAPQSVPHRMGSGAVTAGPPQFAFPRVAVPTVTRPTLTPDLKLELAPDFALQRAPHSTTSTTTAVSRWMLVRRSVAYSIDVALCLAICLTATAFAIALQSEGTVSVWAAVREMEGWSFAAWLLIGVLYSAFTWILVTAQEMAFGTSVGKRLFRLRLEGGVAAIFLRAFFFVPSLGFAGLGLLWGLFDRQRRCWHDLVVDVQPTLID